MSNRLFVFILVVLAALFLARRDLEVWSSPDSLLRLGFLVALLAMFLLLGWGRSRSRGASGRRTGLYVLIWAAAFGVVALGYHLFTDNRGARQAAEFAAASGMASGQPGVNQLELRRARDGHFYVDARANGFDLRLMVDSGATVTAIPFEMAEGLGIDTANLNYLFDVNTANGRVKAALIRLETLDLGSIALRGVQASVLPPGALSGPLLGQNVLNRLQGYVVRGDRMILTGR